MMMLLISKSNLSSNVYKTIKELFIVCKYFIQRLICIFSQQLLFRIKQYKAPKKYYKYAQFLLKL